MAPLQITPGEDRPDAPTEEATPGVPAGPRVDPRALNRRYSNLDQHELITLLDEIDDERSKARFREAVYIALIFWLVFGWLVVYAPRYFWHPPVIVQAPDEKRPTTMTYLDTPPDLKQQLKRTRPTPNISSQSTEAQSPKPSPRAPEPRAGNPTPPAPQTRPQPTPPQQQAPAPQPQQQQQPQPQQQARNTPPTPTPTRPTPQPLADAPSASASQPNRNIFGGQQSAGDAIAGAARGSRSSGDYGDYGSTGRGQTGGAKQGYQILSDTQGVDFGKYIARLLADIRRNWLPLIPEECRPPLNKQGITGVRFTVQPNGAISAMHLDYSTHDVAIDRAAWGSITALGAAQPLPKEFHGPNLELRIEFRVNKDGPDAQ